VRKAGILMHITSLPGPFGIGDLGPAARDFADQLYRSGQQIWQLLPLSPASAGAGYSPYSASSAMAGNIMLISPELLAADGLLDKGSLQSFHLPDDNMVDFESAYANKSRLLEQAYENYCKGKFRTVEKAYRAFCKQYAYWLNDFVRYQSLTVLHKGLPWYEWKKQYRNSTNADIPQLHVLQEKERFWQFLFNQQWHALKNYCNERHIQLLGDLPFYISYNAADVWANRNLFLLDEEGNMQGVAGVPPDYFNEEGQLWNMPVFNWNVLKAQNYKWWISRIRRNLEWYNLLRLDHFRAFANYWEVPAGAPTAVEGQWKNGPGADLFNALQTAFPEMPFVAEDLGDINDAVLQLRDQFKLPGMKVLQFAFGEDMPHSPHIPHDHAPNFFVYTGTHDNNTSRGWFRQDAAPADIDRLCLYTGQTITEEEVAQVLGRMVYASVAQHAVLPMQDVLGLDEKARMNTPAVAGNNWRWRMLPGQFTAAMAARLEEWTIVYNRKRSNT
jgi:4-alpha-glucanotransferase